MNESWPRRIFPDQSSGSGHTLGTSRPPNIIDPIPIKRVCFYKSGDPQFNGLRMVINNRTFKTFDALLDSLSKKVPLPFGVRNITTPRGVHAVHTLEELEDGKAYICSDSHKVKPINLTLARRKLTPWYHARPTTARSRTGLYPGRGTHKQGLLGVRTPKRLTVFRNGDPSVTHAVILQKKIMPTFDSLLDYISDLMQFHVLKLHMADGRRVDGLPALILCSGTVVAAGREPFKPGNYNARKTSVETRLPKRMGPKKLKPFHRKKKSISSGYKSRNFSPSSERYFLNQIQNSITESVCDVPSNPTDSFELDAGHPLKSVAETGGDTCPVDEATGQESCLPGEDDIEKSFRVNHDGSMTVEMKVRLTIKEEETVHWTTTLTRSSVANQLNAMGLPEPEPASEPQSQPDQENSSAESKPQNPQDSAASIDVYRHRSKDDDDDEPPSLDNGLTSEERNEEDIVKAQMVVLSPRRVPNPDPWTFRKKQASMQSIESLSTQEIKEGVFGSYSYREETETVPVTGQYHAIKQTSTRPVPKPRRLASVDVYDKQNRTISSFKSAGMTEIQQIEDSGEEVTETVLHIYEQQTCQENFHANSRCYAQVLSKYSRPATSDTMQFSSNNDFETEQGRPSTASESISIWRAETMSLMSDLTVPSPKTLTDHLSPPITQPMKHSSPKPNTGKDSSQLLAISTKEASQQKIVKKPKMTSSKPNVTRRRVHRIASPGKTGRKNGANASKKHKLAKTFSSAGFIKGIYGRKAKSAKSTMTLRKRPNSNGHGHVKAKSTGACDGTTEFVISDPNVLSAMKQDKTESVSFQKNILDVTQGEASLPRGALQRQKSVRWETTNDKEPFDVGESMSLPAINSSSSVINEYVEQWLEKAQTDPNMGPDDQTQIMKIINHVETDNSMPGESIIKEESSCLEGKTEKPSSPSLRSVPLPDSCFECKVKQRIRSIENKLCPSGSSLEKAAVTREAICMDNAEANTAACNSSAQDDAREENQSSRIVHSETNPPPAAASTDTRSVRQAQKKTTRVKIVLPHESPSMDKASKPGESPAGDSEIPNTERCVTDAASAASSPLYRLSSASSVMSDRPISTSPTSDQVSSPHGHTPATSTQGDVPPDPREAPLSRGSSVKRTRLISSISLERKMSLRKASLEKCALTGEASVTPTLTDEEDENKTANCSSSLGTQRRSESVFERMPTSNSASASLASTPTNRASASPTSLASEERVSSVSFSISEVPPSTHRPCEETNAAKMTPSASIQGEASSPKPAMKKVKLVSNPSLEKKLSSRKASSDMSVLPSDAEKTQASSSPSLGRSPLARNQSSSSVSSRNHSPDKNTRQTHRTGNAPVPNSSPYMQRQPLPPKALWQKRLSPYSQSLEVVSPPMKPRPKKKSLSRNHSQDNTLRAPNRSGSKTPLQRKHHQSPLSEKSEAELPDSSAGQTLLTHATPMPLGPGLHDGDRGSKTDGDEITKTPKLKSPSEEQIMPKPNLGHQPPIKPVLEKICYSIKAIRQITQSKRPSCLEKSNSLPDFSSHVASTFGSSSKALLAFLSVVTLKEGTTNPGRHELNANHVSCAEALKMIDSLREIASIEDSDELKSSLVDLQKSTSTQLLCGWRGFQELSDKSPPPVPNPSAPEVASEASSVEHCVIDGNVIDELMDEFGMPEKLREELATLPGSKTTESDNGEKVAAFELPPEERVNAEFPLFPEEGAVQVGGCDQNENAHFEVKSTIKQFTDISTPKESNSSSLSPSIEMHRNQLNLSGEPKEIYETTVERGRKSKQDGLEEKHELKYPSNGQRQSSEESPDRAVLPDSAEGKENIEATESCSGLENEGNQVTEQGEEGLTEVRSNRQEPHVTCTGVKVSHERSLAENSLSSEGEKSKVKSETDRGGSVSVPEDELTQVDETCSEIGGKNTFRAKKYRDQTLGCQENSLHCGFEKQSGSEEEEPQDECKELQPPGDDNILAHTESPHESEVEEDKRANAHYCEGLSVSNEKSMLWLDMEERSSSEEIQTEVDGEKLQDTVGEDASTVLTCQSDLEQGQDEEPVTHGVQLNVSSDGSTSSPDVVELSVSEEEQPEVECVQQEATIADMLSAPQEHRDSVDEEQNDHRNELMVAMERLQNFTELQISKADIENTSEEYNFSVEEDELYADSLADVQTGDKTSPKKGQAGWTDRPSIFVENHDSPIIERATALTTRSNTSGKRYSFDVDEDSGNDLRSCDEHADEGEQAKAEHDRCTSIEDELSYEERDSSSEDEHASATGYAEEHTTGHRESVSEKEARGEKTPDETTRQSEEIVSPSVAERISLLEQQVASAHRKNPLESSDVRQFAKKDPPHVSAVDEPTSETQASHLGPCTRSSPQSSLAFSYDSGVTAASEPDGNRVKFIKELFLAKSAADVQYGQGRSVPPNISARSDHRPGTSDSGGYQSQTSTELSSGEEDSSQKSIAKGFVRKTIERLYGKKDGNANEAANPRPPSTPKQTQKEGSGIFSPFHAARSKVTSDLSYFNSAAALDTFSEATRCIAFNAQVGPGDSVPIDEGRWLLRENAPIRKSVSDPIGINKTFEKSPPNDTTREDTIENIPYSFFSSKSDVEGKGSSVVTKCTYFSLPHASDSDTCQDDLSTVSKSSPHGDSSVERTEDSEETKKQGQRSSALPGFTATDLRMLDNKVHPLIEGPPHGGAVVVQPRKDHGVVSRRPQEPDVLDILYTFCGQHCPIL